MIFPIPTEGPGRANSYMAAVLSLLYPSFYLDESSVLPPYHVIWHIQIDLNFHELHLGTLDGFQSVAADPGGSRRSPKGTQWPLQVCPKHREATPAASRPRTGNIFPSRVVSNSLWEGGRRVGIKQIESEPRWAASPGRG